MLYNVFCLLGMGCFPVVQGSQPFSGNMSIPWQQQQQQPQQQWNWGQQCMALQTYSPGFGYRAYSSGVHLCTKPQCSLCSHNSLCRGSKAMHLSCPIIVMDSHNSAATLSIMGFRRKRKRVRPQRIQRPAKQEMVRGNMIYLTTLRMNWGMSLSQKAPKALITAKRLQKKAATKKFVLEKDMADLRLSGKSYRAPKSREFAAKCPGQS